MSVSAQIVECNFTTDELAEIQRLEDEVAQASDEVVFAFMSIDESRDHHEVLDACRELHELNIIRDRAISRLTKYKQDVMDSVFTRMYDASRSIV